MSALLEHEAKGAYLQSAILELISRLSRVGRLLGPVPTVDDGRPRAAYPSLHPPGSGNSQHHSPLTSTRAKTARRKCYRQNAACLASRGLHELHTAALQDPTRPHQLASTPRCPDATRVTRRRGPPIKLPCPTPRSESPCVLVVNLADVNIRLSFSRPATHSR